MLQEEDPRPLRGSSRMTWMRMAGKTCSIRHGRDVGADHIDVLSWHSAWKSESNTDYELISSKLSLEEVRPIRRRERAPPTADRRAFPFAGKIMNIVEPKELVAHRSQEALILKKKVR